MRIETLTPAALAIALALSATPTAAQSFWMDRDAGGLALEVLNPRPEGSDLLLSSFAVFATATVQVGNTSLLVVEVPVSYGDAEFWGPEAETALGNPYVGVQSVPDERTGLRWSAGVRFPLASYSGGATETGLSSSATDRLEAFFPDLATLDAASRYIGRLGDMAYLSGSLRAVGYLPTEGGDSELFLQYGARTWLESKGLSAGLGLSGRYLLTESGRTFADRTIHELGIWTDYAFGSVRPGIRVQLPVGEQMRRLVDQVIGVYIRYQLP